MNEKEKISERKKRLKSICKQCKNLTNNNRGITLIALVITILFSYDEELKFSNSKGFLLQTI